MRLDSPFGQSVARLNAVIGWKIGSGGGGEHGRVKVPER